MSERFYWSALAFERFQPLALCVLLYKKNYIFVFSSPEVLQHFFCLNFIWHFIIYYIPCLHVHAPWHYAALM